VSNVEAIKAAITKAALEGGVDPKYALAIAQRESA
jgi:soluble lytic murein transglycosylase-like protein